MMKNKFDDVILNALKEDVNSVDVTSEWLFDESQKSKVHLIAKEVGIVAGLSVFIRTFECIDLGIEFDVLKNDGDYVQVGDVIVNMTGSTKSILMGERTALNFLQRMSGIATSTSKFVEEVKPFPVKIVDTRKTAPGLRMTDKIAVKVGGGYNHRFNLSDGVLIKDNHIKAAGSITHAINLIRENAPHTFKIEIEVESIEELEEAIIAGADIIMLDNMSLVDMKRAVKINNGSALLEASGNMSLDRVKSVAETGVDLISVGALTHSVKALDMSLKFY